MQDHVNEFLDILLGKACFKNVLVELHEAKGDPLKKEIQIKNRSLSFVVYKQFVLWIYQILGKGNMKLLPSCFFLWKIRQHYPEATEQYILYNDGKRN